MTDTNVNVYKKYIPDFVIDEKGNKWDCIVDCIPDGYGGYFVICIEDHCYVILQGAISTSFSFVTHINRTVFNVLRELCPL